MEAAEQREPSNLAGTGEGSSKVSSVAGLAQVFYQPTEFFEKLKENPRVIVPYFVFVILMAVFFYGTRELLWEMASRTPQFQSQAETLSAEKLEMIRKLMWIQPVIVVSLLPVVAALFAYFWGNFIFAGKAKFKQILSVMTYGSLISGLGGLVVLPMALAKGHLAVGLSLGPLAASQGIESLAFVALSKIDVFIIWEIMVIGIGLAAVYGLPRNKGIRLSVLSMGMLSILHVVTTAIGKAFF